MIDVAIFFLLFDSSSLDRLSTWLAEPTNGQTAIKSGWNNDGIYT